MSFLFNACIIALLLLFSRYAVSDSLWPHGLQPARLLCLWNFPSKNTGVGCHFLLQGIFPTQGLNPHLLCFLLCRQILYCLSHWESWDHKEMIAFVAVIVPTSALELCHINTQSTTVYMFPPTIQDSFLPWWDLWKGLAPFLILCSD